ncbi:MAG: ribosome silencing factor [Candidatus Methylomirabilota bacterium]|nr:ribosome silencing factor [Candidatus Methylomirabilis sp.]NJD69580.1 ribosome silencing factor [candidate division NC10 bacterium]PWB47523.1 MAG: ribosome silencing factor [candidate division NC10 bacterium]
MSTPEQPAMLTDTRGMIDADALLQLAVTAASDVKPTSLVHLDLRGLCSFTDHFLIVGVPSVRQVRAVAERIEERLREAHVRMSHREGDLEARWILLDYSDVIIHIFDEEMRLYYDLEGLWADAPKRELV